MPRTNNGEFVTEASKMFQAGDDCWHGGQYDEARKKYLYAADLYHKTGDTEGEAFVYSRLGELELSLDNYKEAEKALRQSTALVENYIDGQNTYGEALIKLSKVQTASGEDEKALQTIKKAQEVTAATDNKNLLGDAYEQEAYICLLNNKEQQALEKYRLAADLFNQDGTTLKEAATLRAMARLEMKFKNYDVAHDLLERCRNLYRENGDLLGEASALSAIGCLRYIIRDIPNARKALMKSVYLYGKVSHHFAEAEALLYLARVEAFNQEQGDFERAKIHYKRSIELFDFLENETMKRAVLDEYHDFLNRISTL